MGSMYIIPSGDRFKRSEMLVGRKVEPRVDTYISDRYYTNNTKLIDAKLMSIISAEGALSIPPPIYGIN